MRVEENVNDNLTKIIRTNFTGQKYSFRASQNLVDGSLDNTGLLKLQQLSIHINPQLLHLLVLVQLLLGLQLLGEECL